MRENDFTKYGEADVSKRNRRRKSESKKHDTIVGPMPPTGIHKESRRDRDRKINLAIKKILK